MGIRIRTTTGVCNQRGVILTCYVNGRKRFRAVPTDVERLTAEPTVGDAPNDMHAARSRPAATGVPRDAR